MTSILSHPSFRTEPVRNTAAWACMVWRCREGLQDLWTYLSYHKYALLTHWINLRFQTMNLIHNIVGVPSACWAWSLKFSVPHWKTSACPGWQQTLLLRWASVGTVSHLRGKNKKTKPKSRVYWNNEQRKWNWKSLIKLRDGYPHRVCAPQRWWGRRLYRTPPSPAGS